MAYETNESGRFEIVVQPFPSFNDARHVSTSGGTQARWGADDHEIYFLAPDGKLTSAPITTTRRGDRSTLEVGQPVALFPTRILNGDATVFRPQYAVSRDGRFLINQPAEETTTTPVTLILNWRPPASQQ